MCLVLWNVWAKHRISARPNLWLWMIWITKTVLPVGAKKAQPLHNCPWRPGDAMDRNPMYAACWNLIHMVVQRHVWEWLEQLKGCFCIWEPWTRRTVMISLTGVTDFIQHRPVSSLQLHRIYLFSVCKCSRQGSYRLPWTVSPRKWDGEVQSLFAVLPPNLDASQVHAEKSFASRLISRVYGCTKTDRPAEPIIQVTFINPFATYPLGGFSLPSVDWC